MNTQVSVPISCLRPCLSERLPLKQFIRPSEHRVAEIIYEKIQRWKVKMFLCLDLCVMVQKKPSHCFFLKWVFQSGRQHIQTKISSFSTPQREEKKDMIHIFDSHNVSKGDNMAGASFRFATVKIQKHHRKFCIIFYFLFFNTILFSASSMAKCSFSSLAAKLRRRIWIVSSAPIQVQAIVNAVHLFYSGYLAL